MSFYARRPVCHPGAVRAKHRKWIEWGAWAIALVLLGWGLPKLLGVVYADTLLNLTYAGLTILFAAPIVADRVFADRGRSLFPLYLHRHLASGAAFGFLSFLLLMAIQDMLMRYRSGGQLGLDWIASHRLLLLAAACSLFGAALAAAVTVRMTNLGRARQLLRTGFLVALLVALYGLRRLSDDTRFELMTMAAPGSGARMFGMVTVGLIVAAAALAWLASRDPRYNAEVGK